MTTTIRNAATFYGYGGQHLLDVVRATAMTLEGEREADEDIAAGRVHTFDTFEEAKEWLMTDQVKVPQPGNEPLPPTEETEPPLEDDATVQHEAPEE
jgi:hypothetical protein